MPKVSVIIPNYNHAPYLEQRIDSVLRQTYQDFEVMILDDCSVDDSRDIIERYRNHPKITAIVYNETNSGGPFPQWKKGIELSRGDYVWLAESDDWCEPTLLETLVKALDENDSCVLAYVQTHTVSGGNIIQSTSHHDKLEEYVDGRKYINRYLTAGCAIWNSSMLLLKRRYYFNISQEFTTFKMCGDWLFYIEMAQQGEVFISGKVLNYFRSHDQDVSGKMYSSGKNYIEELRILKKLQEKSLISLDEFKQNLLDKYIRFLVFKHEFDKNVVKQVEDSFYQDGNRSYKGFLNFRARANLLKIKIRRRLNLILS
ncbi:MAG: glycosyltransferase family 2 protein [Mucilaginibacter sp.]